MADGRDGRRDAERLRHAPRPGWSTPAATTGASRVNSTLHGLGFRDEHLDRSLETFSRRRADARLAGAGAGRRSRPAAARRAHQPPRHRVAGVAGDASAVARRRRRAGRARSLVPGGGRHVGAGARGRAREVLQGHLARVARREGAARAGAGPRDREAAGGDRQARALRRPLQRRHPLTPGDLARRRSSTRSSGSTTDPKDGKGLGFAFKPPERSGRVVFEVEDGLLKIGDRVLLQDAELWLERAEHVSLVGANGSGKTTLITALTGGREFDGGKLRTGPQRQARAAGAARRGARAAGGRCWRPASARRG